MDRAVDFAYYAGLPDGAGHLMRAGERRRGRRLVEPHAARTRGARWTTSRSRPARTRPVVTIAALACGPGRGARWLVITIPGPHPAVPWLLERGARITDRDQYCATDPSLLDPERILPSPGFL